MTKEMVDNSYVGLLQNLKKEITQVRIKVHLLVNSLLTKILRDILMDMRSGADLEQKQEVQKIKVGR